MKINCNVENVTRNLWKTVHNLKIFPKKIPGPETFIGEFFQIFKEEIILILHKFFYKLEKEGTFRNSFYMAGIILIPKPDEDIRKKTCTNLIYEYRHKNSKQMEFSNIRKG